MSIRKLETIVQKARIERVLTTYATALDERDWQTMGLVFAPDAVAVYESIGEFVGRPAVLDVLRSSAQAYGKTQHALSNIRIKVRDNHAEARTYMQAMLSGKGENEGRTQIVWGEYTDKLENKEDRWCIVHRTLSIIHVMGDAGALSFNAEPEAVAEAQERPEPKFKIFVFIKRKPGITIEQMIAHYESHHAPMALRLVPGVRRYLRNFVRPCDATGMPWKDREVPKEVGELPHDVVTEMWFDSREAFELGMKALTDPKAAQEVTEDEDRMFDRSSIRVAAVEVHESTIGQ
jgi:ketosteroid isomerase-like protein